MPGFRGTQWRGRSPRRRVEKHIRSRSAPAAADDSATAHPRDGGPEWIDLSLHYLETQFTLSHLAAGYCAVCKMS